MDCRKCVWGKVVSNKDSERGQLTTILCGRVFCPDQPDKAKENDMTDKPLIYVCSPLNGDRPKNQARAARYCRFVTQCHAIPIAPHLFFTQFLDDALPEDRAMGLELGLNILTRCAQVWVFGEVISPGMQEELELAQRFGIPVRFYDRFCQPREEDG